jgi:hypothetical protein
MDFQDRQVRNRRFWIYVLIFLFSLVLTIIIG